MLAVEREEVVREGVVHQGVTPPPHRLRRGRGEGVAGVADHGVSSFWDVDLCERNPADLGVPEEEVPAHR